MEIKTGIDLVEVDRIRKSIRNPRFLTRVFSEKERAFLEQKGFPVQSIAAGYAAKEAFAKALGTGVRGFWLSEVSVLRGEAGEPYLEFSGKAEKLVCRDHYRFSVSLTHTDAYAAAVVVAYRD